MLLFIFALVVALILLPFVYKGELVGAVKDALNKNLNAEVDFADLDLSFIKSFPDVAITIHSPEVHNDASFDNGLLLKADRLVVDMDFMSFIQEENPYKINSISLEEGDVHVIVDKTGNYNYEIWNRTETDESSAYTLELKNYSLQDVNLLFQDRQNDTEISAQGIRHTGKGDFTQDVFKLSTESDIQSLSISKNNFPYLNKVQTKGSLDLEIDNTTNSYTISNNDIRLENLKINTEGYVQLKDEDINMDLEITSDKGEFGDFLSIIPLDLKKDLAGLDTKGNASIEAKIKGRYSDTTLPMINSKIIVENGYVKNANFSEPIQNIYTDLSIRADDKNWDDLEINLDNLKMNIAGEEIDGRFKYSNVMTDPLYDVVLNGNLNLNKLSEILPIENVNSMTGSVLSDLTFKGRQSDIETENYEALTFDMTLQSDGLTVDYKEGNDLVLSNFNINSTPQNLNVNTLEGKMGSSDYTISGNVKNPLAILTSKNNISGHITHTSTLLDLDELMHADDKSTTSSPTEIDQNLIDKSKLKFTSEVKTIQYLGYDIKNFQAEGILAANNLEIQKSNVLVEGSSIQAKGNLRNAYNHVSKNDSLYGNLDIYTKKFDVNKFITEDESAKSEALRIPQLYNIDMDIKADEVLYSNTKIESFNSDLLVKNGIASLVNSTSKAMGGDINFEGFYDSVSESPAFSFKYELSKFNFQETFKNLASFRVMAPVAEFIEGVFNSTLVMSGNLKNGFELDYNTISASGFLETLNSKLSGYTPVTDLANKLGVEKLKQINLENTKNWFEIADGGVVLKAHDYMMDDIKMRIGGTQKFDSDIDYVAQLEIPRSRFNNSTVGTLSDAGIGFLEKEAGKLGVNLDVGDFIYLDVSITGTIKNPKFKVVPTGAGGKSLTETTKDIVTNVIEDKKREYQDKANEKINVVKDSVTHIIESKRDSLIAQAEKKADKAVQVAKDTIKAKVKTKVVAVVKDTLATKLEDKVKDVLGDQTGELDKLKDKLKNKLPGFPKKNND